MKIPLMNIRDGYTDYREELDIKIKELIDNASFIGGEEVESFEKEWADYCSIPYAIGCSNGTDAITVSLKALGIDSSSSVIVPTNTFIATAEAVASLGATLILCDVDKLTGLLDLNQLEVLLEKNKVDVVIAVHLYGQMIDMELLSRFSKVYGFKILEDSAQAHGATFKGNQPGHYGDVATFSFYPGKNLGAWGDAGGIITKNNEIYLKCKQLVNHGRVFGKKYEHSLVGYNNRLDSIQAAVLRAKIPYLDLWNNKRQVIADMYNDFLKGKNGLLIPQLNGNCKSVWYVYSIVVKERERLIKILEENGISYGIYFPIPIHLQPAFSILNYRKGSFPNAEDYTSKTISLPLWPEMSSESVAYICDTIIKNF